MIKPVKGVMGLSRFLPYYKAKELLWGDWTKKTTGE